jgi:hypothetical protein
MFEHATRRAKGRINCPDVKCVSEIETIEIQVDGFACL